MVTPLASKSRTPWFMEARIRQRRMEDPHSGRVPQAIFRFTRLVCYQEFPDSRCRTN